MKKIVNYCDICKENYETAKCSCCECSLCKGCALTFLIHIGDYEACHPKYFCRDCFPKIQLTKTKKGKKFLKETKKEILTELNKRIEKCCPICDLKLK